MNAPRHLLVSSLVVLGLASVASAQSAAPPPPLGTGGGLNQMYATIKTYLSESADKMPEAEFSFRPAADVRTYGEIVGHISNAGFASCAGMLSEANPNKDNLEQQGANKAAAAASLKAMFTYCDKAFATITDANAGELMTRGQRQVARSVPAASLVAHLNEHYGSLVTYMRIKGIVPPSTERAMRR